MCVYAKERYDKQPCATHLLISYKVMLSHVNATHNNFFIDVVRFNMAIVDVKVSELKVDLNCSKTLAEANKTTFTVKLQEASPSTGDVPKYKTIQCNGTTQRLVFNDLQKYTVYNTSAFWNPECPTSRSQNRTLWVAH